ncbi:uncharacterized protein LOC8064444 [Sorghum bicolor]|uniref:IST1-like protein n=2 Tax=Sorghum bicolor TaxID=4558 RepID=C5X721_SORBI|nr:uncharacterized protein LOC8064444 [Sorghum bicolor]EER99304.1 hypothetical protein SORBI_3002G286100 [Sorghum bicolor]|eukprot:XP_002462783.1 uncharacterized protein LOC8064444 [Sorghum bicolor]
MAAMMMATGDSKSPARALRRLAGAAVAAVLLRRSFSASKCKTEARMATARMKLLRNRREAQVRQMRRDIAALLRDKQEDTARIRVEHVIREQNFMAANEIIELFCELIVTRLPIIAKQKECPADLKEGICSLIFAAPRCSELPELGRMRDIFEKKYGKDFVSAAVDLRPDAAVNNLLIEKLSVKKPSGQIKLKVLKDIAKEHQIDWDTTESEQELLKPPEELIKGPSTFVEASNMPVKTILTPHVLQPNPVNFSYRYSDDEYDDRGTMQFKDAASAARAAAESAERAASAAKAAADFANKNNHPFDEDEDCKASSNEFTHPRKRQSMSNSSRSSRKEDADAFDEVKPHGGRASSTGSFSGKNHVEDDNDRYPVDLDSRKTRRRNGRAARKVHSEIKFDDSEGLCSESEDENDVEIQSVERPLPPTREPFSENRHSEDEEPDQDFPELPKANLHSRVHPNMPLDYETLTARFEALKSGKLP